jgi:hypothetical protein
MSTTQQSSIADPLKFALRVRFSEQYAALCQKLVVLPDTDVQRAWLVDLHDPFHPIVQGFDSMAAAEAARSERIYQALCSLATEVVTESAA